MHCAARRQHRKTTTTTFNLSFFRVFRQKKVGVLRFRYYLNGR